MKIAGLLFFIFSMLLLIFLMSPRGGLGRQAVSLKDIDQSSVLGEYKASHDSYPEYLTLFADGNYLLEYSPNKSENFSIHDKWDFSNRAGQTAILLRGVSSGRDPFPPQTPEYKRILKVWPEKNDHSVMVLLLKRDSQTGCVYVELHPDTEDSYRRTNSKICR